MERCVEGIKGQVEAASTSASDGWLELTDRNVPVPDQASGLRGNPATTMYPRDGQNNVFSSSRMTE